MSNPLHTTRRAALVGAFASTAALAVPFPAHASAGRPASPIPAMVTAHAAALAELKAANAAYDAPFAAYQAENERNPVMVDLPGFRFNMARVRATRTSPIAIEERYAQHYHLFSGKSGGRIIGGEIVFTDKAEIAADQARDLAAALANWDAARAILQERADRFGLTAAEKRIDNACEALEAAWVALLTYVPRNLDEMREKAAAVLAVVKADPVQLDEEHAELFLSSLVGEVA